MKPLYHQVFDLTIFEPRLAAGANVLPLIIIAVSLGLALIGLVLLLRRGQRSRRQLQQRVAELSALSDASRAIVAAGAWLSVKPEESYAI